MINNKFKLRFTALTMFFLFILVIATNSTNNMVSATEDDEHAIDISSGYTSDIKNLVHDQNITYEFEITTPMNFTFEILDLNGSLYMYRFDHEDHHHDDQIRFSIGESQEGDHPGEEDANMTADGFPMGFHVETHVRRHLIFNEIGNITLLLSNSHPHPSDAVQFQLKFSVGVTGEEILGTVPEEDHDEPTSGFEFLSLVVFLPILGLLVKKKKKRKNK